MNIKSNFFVVFAIILLNSCSVDKDSRLEMTPDEYEYLQRSYPYNIINNESVLQVREDVKKIKSNRVEYLKNNNEWNSEGPTNIGGRVTDIARHPTDSETFYIGCSVGGVFKTTDGGSSWKPIFDDVLSPSIGNIAISPSSPEVIYVGTGEANGSSGSGAFFGTGIYKSNDGGETWKSAGLERSNHIGRLHVDTENSDIVYAAATGVLYGKGTNRGLYKTIDGGENWQKLLYVSDSTSCIDLVVHPEDPNTIYAATWERQRFAWIRDYGGPTSAIYKTSDGGQNWTRLENGLPDNIETRGRIGISMSQTNPDVLFASITNNEITNEFEGIYRTDNGGEQWENVSSNLPNNTFSSFGWFFGNLRVDPINDNNVYVLGLNAFKTEDSGDSWGQLEGMHVDMHAMEIFESNPNDILIGNDGGLYRSMDGGQNFTYLSNIPLTQFYNIEIDFQKPERLFGGTQDNNTVGTFTGNSDDYDRLIGGDGFHVIVDPRNSDRIYAESQWGNLRKSEDGGQIFRSATDGIEDDDRRNWNTPVVISPFNPAHLYYGTNRLYTSIEATEWMLMSDDLSKGAHPSGSVSFGTITTIAPSYNNLNVVYVGTDDGEISITQDGGNSWRSIDNGTPERYVTRIAINPFDDSEAIVCFSGYQYLDYEPHIMITNDYGMTWSDIGSNLPPFPINDVVYNPDDDSEIYIGTDMGAWYSLDKGNSWNILGKGLPPTIVKDIKIHGPTKTLVAGTYGRSIYSVSIEGSLSVSEGKEESKFEIYPNPAIEGSPVFLKSENQTTVQISIHSVDGRLIRKMEDLESGSSIGSFAKGQYLITLKSGNINERKILYVN